ncbi:MAG: ABC transporter ATP-binding protein [Ignavibacteriales bacterium]|nr:ABC transporter ATP-binding protein [Ignavibacteriales bacterium]
MSSEIVLRTIGLGKSYRGRRVVQDLNLEVRRGDVFGFLGPNGAGKSTTIRMILSLITPLTGSVEIFGQDLHRNRERALASVAGIVEKPDFYLYLSAVRNMQIAGSLTLRRTPKKEKIDVCLGLVGLSDRAGDRVKTYSHGMKQRLGIAQALLCDPELIILDEPTNGLDPQGMKEVRELVHHLATEKGITVFLSSHLLNEVEQVATRMAIINKGNLIVQGSVDELLRSNANTVVVNVTPQKKALLLLQKMRSASVVETAEQGIRVEIDQKRIPAMVAALVESGCQVHAVIPEKSLERYFLSMTEQS